MLALAPARLPAPSAVDRPQVFAAEGPRRARVALLSGCAQQVLAPAINEATIRLLTRHGVEVVVAKGAGCCGALVHHMGREAQALAAARANIDAWERERERGGLDAVIINASGCGTTVKDYGFMLREDPAYAEKAARIAALAKDVTEFLAGLDLRADGAGRDLVVAYHSACSMQHGQKITDLPKDLLKAAGFTVKDIPEGHICCGSAGTYNLLQPELARQLRERKLAQHRARPPGRGRDRQHRLHGAARRRRPRARRAHRGAARLGDRRTASAGSCGACLTPNLNACLQPPDFARTWHAPLASLSALPVLAQDPDRAARERAGRGPRSHRAVAVRRGAERAQSGGRGAGPARRRAGDRRQRRDLRISRGDPAGAQAARRSIRSSGPRSGAWWRGSTSSSCARSPT